MVRQLWCYNLYLPDPLESSNKPFTGEFADPQHSLQDPEQLVLHFRRPNKLADLGFVSKDGNKVRRDIYLQTKPVR